MFQRARITVRFKRWFNHSNDKKKIASLSVQRDRGQSNKQMYINEHNNEDSRITYILLYVRTTYTQQKRYGRPSFVQPREFCDVLTRRKVLR